MPDKKPYGNLLLDRLTSTDLALLAGDLERVSLPIRRRLHSVERKINDVYFVSEGIVSVVATNGRKGKPAEVGIIGNEGMSGIEVLLADDRSQHEVLVQVAGHGFRMPAERLAAAMDKSATLRRALLRFSSAFLVQITETALASATANVEQRLARWLLLADDRLYGNVVPLTHEFLAIMLCVRRSGVTVAIRQLAKRGLVRNSRGFVVIADRAGLAAHAGAIYGRSRKELERLTA
ncbi:MAG TPA: Crp/Fnr family transcriptional regulator [Bauldia sp.]|nr:Crp/Fnr family transcriptional regulator [Bauldia sp.]